MPRIKHYYPSHYHICIILLFYVNIGTQSSNNKPGCSSHCLSGSIASSLSGHCQFIVWSLPVHCLVIVSCIVILMSGIVLSLPFSYHCQVIVISLSSYLFLFLLIWCSVCSSELLHPRFSQRLPLLPHLSCHPFVTPLFHVMTSQSEPCLQNLRPHHNWPQHLRFYLPFSAFSASRYHHCLSFIPNPTF
jgi:hypothetical protein